MITLFFLAISSSSPDCNCIELKDESKENYLYKICEYIQEKNIDVSPGNPCDYKIETIREEKIGDTDVMAVHLNCCHAGDIAYFDKKTCEIINFRLGPK